MSIRHYTKQNHSGISFRHLPKNVLCLRTNGVIQTLPLTEKRIKLIAASLPNMSPMTCLIRLVNGETLQISTNKTVRLTH